MSDQNNDLATSIHCNTRVLEMPQAGKRISDEVANVEKAPEQTPERQSVLAGRRTVDLGREVHQNPALRSRRARSGDIRGGRGHADARRGAGRLAAGAPRLAHRSDAGAAELVAIHNGPTPWHEDHEDHEDRNLCPL